MYFIGSFTLYTIQPPALSIGWEHIYLLIGGVVKIMLDGVAEIILGGGVPKKGLYKIPRNPIFEIPNKSKFIFSPSMPDVVLCSLL